MYKVFKLISSVSSITVTMVLITDLEYDVIFLESWAESSWVFWIVYCNNSFFVVNSGPMHDPWMVANHITICFPLKFGTVLATKLWNIVSAETTCELHRIYLFFTTNPYAKKCIFLKSTSLAFIVVRKEIYKKIFISFFHIFEFVI